jgi:hypothetical protein
MGLAAGFDSMFLPAEEASIDPPRSQSGTKNRCVLGHVRNAATTWTYGRALSHRIPMEFLCGISTTQSAHLGQKIGSATSDLLVKSIGGGKPRSVSIRHRNSDPSDVKIQMARGLQDVYLTSVFHCSHLTGPEGGLTSARAE